MYITRLALESFEVVNSVFTFSLFETIYILSAVSILA
jgi:hypothetical protein